MCLGGIPERSMLLEGPKLQPEGILCMGLERKTVGKSHEYAAPTTKTSLAYINTIYKIFSPASVGPEDPPRGNR